jgi:hypothetical protein
MGAFVFYRRHHRIVCASLISMKPSAAPRPFEEWRKKPIDRAEDAAYTFGSHLVQHCRTETLKGVEAAAMPKTMEEFHEQVTRAVDRALCGVVNLLEGNWPAQAGSNHRVAYALSVCVSSRDRKPVERIDISPYLLDLPIGYWKWRDGEFR